MNASTGRHERKLQLQLPTFAPLDRRSTSAPQQREKGLQAPFWLSARGKAKQQAEKKRESRAAKVDQHEHREQEMGDRQREQIGQQRKGAEGGNNHQRAQKSNGANAKKKKGAQREVPMFNARPSPASIAALC